jgi:membrane-bound serine protease (ClpP class)
MLLCALPLAGGNAASSRPQILIADIKGVIAPVTVEIVARALDQASHDNDAAVVLRLDTPGGLMESMRNITQRIIASPVPVITWIAPAGARGASAGFFILESGDVASMAPGTNTGAAHPVLVGTEMDPIMKQKVENDAAASLRSVTSRRGRNSDLAEKAVRESKSFTEKEALENKLIEIVAANEHDLIAQLDGRTVTRFDGSSVTLHLRDAEVRIYQPNLRQQILSAISDPNMALILLVVGALLLYVEFSNPGMVVPGVFGAVLLLLGLSAFSVLPINWLGAGLLLLALTMFVLEAKFATHGVLTAGGAVSMILGAMLLVDSPLPELRIRLATAISVALPFAVITAFLVSLAVRARANKVATGVEGMIGEIGVALEDLNPAGRIFVHGEYWNAVSSAPVTSGNRARVLAVDHLTLAVEPVSQPAVNPVSQKEP